MKILKDQLEEEGLLERCLLCYNGNEAVEMAKKVI